MTVKSTDGIDLISEGIPGLVELLWRSRRWLAVGLLCGVVVGVALGLMLPKQYEADATIIAASQFGSGNGLASLGQIASAASSFGVNLGTTASDPSFLFPFILRNREVSQRILEAPYVDRDGNATSLVDCLLGEGGESKRRVDRAREVLHRRVLRYDQDRRSGVSQVKVRLDDPDLAAQVVNRCLDELDRYYLKLKTQIAGGEYGFVAERMEEVASALEVSEERLLEFRSNNRSVSSSPSLLLEQERLIRELELNQQVFVTLHTQREISSIERERRLPVLVVLDKGHSPVQAASPRIVPLVLIWALLGASVAFVVVIVHNATLVYRRQVDGSA